MIDHRIAVLSLGGIRDLLMNPIGCVYCFISANHEQSSKTRETVLTFIWLSLLF